MIMAIVTTANGVTSYTFADRNAFKHWMSTATLAGITKIDVYFDIR
jgi:hypothetical protein